MRRTPLISLTNLVEYATTPSAARRRSIIEQYHQPQIIKFDWRGASDVIFIKRACGLADADDLIDFEKERIRNQLSGEKEKDRRLHHILHLIELLEASDFSGLTIGTVPSPANNLSTDSLFGMLTVRVRPDLILSRPRFGAKGFDRGILKCHNLSTFKLTPNTGPMFAVGLQVFAENVLGLDDTISDLCRVYDLFDDNFYTAPKNQKRIRAQLFEASQEILDRWEAVGARVVDKTLKRRKAS
mgnify:CR=1 FL=1